MTETGNEMRFLVCPLAAGLLTGEQRRGEAAPAGSRRTALGDPGTLDVEQGFRIPYPYWHQQRFNAPRMRYTVSGAGLE